MTGETPETAVWLGGGLATHRRGAVLQETAGARPMPSDHEVDGIGILFGSEFQTGGEPFQREWLAWCQLPGRSLLLVPPFEVMGCVLPTGWEMQRRFAPPALNAPSLIQALALEVRFVLSGTLQNLSDAGGIWDDLTASTGYYRKHPHSGIFAVTCLPLWSLVTLDRAVELRAWLEALHTLAGKPVPVDLVEEAVFAPGPDHFVVLLHLLTGPFDDAGGALSSLQSSSIFSLAPERASACLTEMQAHGLSSGGQMTAAGRELLRHSPYAAYADVLEVMKR